MYYFEEGRRHKIIDTTGKTITNGATKTITVDMGNAGDDKVVAPNDLVMDVVSGDVFLVTDTNSLGKIGGGATAAAAGAFVIETLDDEAPARTLSAGDKLAIVGNMHAQGSAEPGSFYEPDVQRHTQTFAIVKNKYEVNGSQATNVGYVNVGNGDYRWFIKGEMEARKRFEDLREMTLLFGEQTAEAFQTASNEGITGSEGYFSAVNDRGIVVSGATADGLNSLSEFDAVIKLMDKQGAPAEYAMYVNRQQSLDIDDMLAGGVSTQLTAGLAGRFGAFSNDADMAVQLGFKSFTRGGYTFHKHDWRLLNDPTMLGAADANYIQGAMVPLRTVNDARSGASVPALSMHYKEANGYSREMEHWVTGGGVLGHTNNGDAGTDQAVFHYRSEIALCVRAANQHVIIKGS